MVESRSPEPSDPTRKEERTASDSPDWSNDEPNFGGEPAEIIQPQLRWPQTDSAPTRITNSPIISSHQPEPLRPAELTQLLIGERLEHFELEEMVGGGGMGAVFRAIDTRLNRTVAVKVLPREQALDDEVVRRFRNEAQSAARLDHDNIARVYYVGEDKGLHFIAFEFIEGQNLRDLVLNQGPLAIPDALDIVLQIADALGHASGRDVVHRDIKPSNVLITQEGRAKLVDMGLARLHQIDRSHEDLTASGVTLGTFDYISPEQARDPRNADVRSDMYSLGCTLFFILTGRPPFPEGTVLQKLLQHQGDEPPDPRELNADVPAELSRLLRRMMAKEPRQRPQTAEELVRELLVIGAQYGLKPVTSDSLALAAHQNRPQTFLERHLPWMLPVAALAAVILVLEVSSRRDRAKFAGLPNRIAATGVRPREAIDVRPGTEARDSAENLAPTSAVDLPNSDITTTDPLTEKIPAGATTGRPAQAPPFVDATPTKKPGTATSPALVTKPKPAVVEIPDPIAIGTAHPAQGLIQQLDGGSVTKLESAGASAVAATSVAASAVEPDEKASSGVNIGDGTTLSDPEEAEPAEAERRNSGAAGAATSPEIQPGVLVVIPGTSSGSIYPTLGAACAAAQPGDVIELRYQGRQEERPIELRNLRLTIRAGERFHPIIAFRPQDTDPLRYARSMFSVTGGRLVLVNLAIELELPREMPADRWSLLKLQQTESIQLESCSLTIRNGAERGTNFHESVSFFSVVATPGAGAMPDVEEAPVAPVAIQLQNCIARGEAVFLAHHDVQPCQLEWNNGLLATSERFLVAAGGRKAPASGSQLRVDLRHVTGDVRNGLCLFTNSNDAPYLLPAEIKCSNSILLGSGKEALIEQSGIDGIAEFRQQLHWDSERNFYDGIRVFWTIRGRNLLEQPEEINLTNWQAFWHGSERSWGRVGWKKLPDAARAVSTCTPGDYALDATLSNNPAIRGAADGRDAGCDAGKLPVLQSIPGEVSQQPWQRSRDDLTR